jgi:hypothetical protein
MLTPSKADDKYRIRPDKEDHMRRFFAALPGSNHITDRI